MKKEIRAFGYIRGSTEEQINTLEAQRTAIERYCASYGLILVGIFIDSGISGSSAFLERPAVLQMLEAMDAQDVHQIVFTKLDRAFRSVLDCVKTIAAWSDGGIGFHIIEQRIDTSSAIGRAMLQMVAVIAELENGQRSERQLAAFQVMRANGRRCGAVPYGWHPVASNRQSRTGRQADNLAPVQFEQAVLQTMRAMHDQGQTDNKIARFLNARGIPAKKGGRWYGATVTSVLKHARIAESTAQEAA